jgi:hypothetical protein
MDQALFDPDFIFKKKAGKVDAGTLEGLVEFLLCHGPGRFSPFSFSRP